MLTETVNRQNLDNAHRLWGKAETLKQQIASLDEYLKTIIDTDVKWLPSVSLMTSLKGFTAEGLGFLNLDLSKEEIYLFVQRKRDKLQRELDAIRLPELTFHDKV